MSTARLIAKNTGVLIVGEVISRLLSFFLVILIASRLGDTGLGKYSFVFAFIGIFSVLSDLGTTVYMTREVSRDYSLTKDYLGKVFVIKLAVGIISILLPAVIIFFTNQPIEIKIGVVLAGLAMFMYYIAYPFRAVVNAYEIQNYQSWYVMSERIIAFVLGVFILYRGYGLIALLVVLVISNASSWLLLYTLVSKKIVKLVPSFNINFAKDFLKNSFPFWFTTIFITIYFKIDTVMLSFMADYAATGWYNASYKIIDALSFVPFVVIIAVFPVMSKLFRKSNKTLQILYEKSFYYLSCLALPLGLGITLLAGKIILAIYSKEFANSILALQILVWALVFMFVNYLMGYLLNSIDKQKLFTISTGLSAALNIILNFMLIPLYSYKGAAAATVITEMFNFMLLFYFTSKNGFRINLLKMIYKPIIATSLMGIFIFYLMKMNYLFLIPLSIVFYFIVLFLIKGIGKQEFDIAKSIILK